MKKSNWEMAQKGYQSKKSYKPEDRMTSNPEERKTGRTMKTPKEKATLPNRSYPDITISSSVSKSVSQGAKYVRIVRPHN